MNPSEPSHDPLKGAPRLSADAATRLNADAGALIVLARHEAAARALAVLRTLDRPAPGDGIDALLEGARQELDAMRGTLAQATPGQERAQHRFVCDALRLHRACARGACRRARRCRGNALACVAKADVPEAVLDHIAATMVAASAPALGLLSRGRAENRVAYESWIAGIEAGARRA